MDPKVPSLLRVGKQTGTVARAAPFSKGRWGRFRGGAWEEGEEFKHLTAICRLGVAMMLVDADDPSKASVALGFPVIL